MIVHNKPNTLLQLKKLNDFKKGSLSLKQKLLDKINAQVPNIK